MKNSIFSQAIKSAPRLLWQSYAQPSKAVEFISQDRRNQIIFLWSFFFSGLVLGSVLAIPHYFLYHDLLKSILFAVAVAGAIAFASAGAFASANAVIGSGIIIYITALGISISPAFVILLLILSASAAGWFILYLLERDRRKSTDSVEILMFFFSIILMLLAGGEGIRMIEVYEMALYPLAFLANFFLGSSFEFSESNRKYKKDFESNGIGYSNVTHQMFEKVQKSSILWGPGIGILLCLPVYFNWKPDLNEKILIAALGFTVMPFFILHVPDNFLCLPVWFFQRRRILKKYTGGKDIEKAYKKSLLFTHERMYLQLPGLGKVMASMAGNSEIGIRETVKRIDHLYRFTFQQKQAKKAIITLGNDRETAHRYIQFLLEEKNRPLLETLAKKSRLAALYLLLFENTGQKPGQPDEEIYLKKEEYRRLAWLFRRDIFITPTEEKRNPIPKSPVDRIKYVYNEMSGEEGYLFNGEMVSTLTVVHRFRTAGSLKDFYRAVDSMGELSGLPHEIGYFSAFESVISQLRKIKQDIEKIEGIERFETRRSFLNEQKEKISTLARTAAEIFYQPFQSLWENTLIHCSELVEQELKTLQGSASLAVDLQNKEILVPADERILYFDIHNKGRELASRVNVALQPDTPLIYLTGARIIDVGIIESDAVKKIAFPISAPTPGKTTVRGTVTFSDRTREDKTVEFSFPLTLVKKSVEFKPISNPYVVGQPLKGDTPLYFGREDAFEFIDKNIIASGDHHTIVCHGLRRTGKSSLLYRIESKGFTDSRLVPVNIDMQGISDEADFYATLSGKIREKFAMIPGTAVDSFSRFKVFLKEIKPTLGERIVVLMVDEFEELQMRVEDRRISRTIFSNIRHLMQHEEKLIFLFCGTHRLEEMSADYWSIFFNTAMNLRISLLKPNDALRLIKEPVKGQLNYDELASAQILKMTGGQPYLTQLVCRTIVNHLNDHKKRNDAVIDDVDDAVESIISGGSEHFSQHIWDESNPLEQLLLSAAAGEMTLRQLDFIGMETLFDTVLTAEKSVSRKQMSEALERLVSREILEEKDMRYRFPVNLLRKWLAARFPLRKVRDKM